MKDEASCSGFDWIRPLKNSVHAIISRRKLYKVSHETIRVFQRQIRHSLKLPYICISIAKIG
ncbi:hypothetical protein Pvag_pPag20218 (plasmid) [Pantoea vagans C9-1]|nr:hypothetical protein Pvag_pPag20218 [Pantoea vagans C9-1]